MAITDAQKVDLLYKKIGFGVAKTDTSAFKSPSNEANASPLLTRGDTIWVESGLIPGVKPASNSSVLVLYQQSLSSAVECTLDSTVSGTNRTWLTNYNDWISAEFGPSYQVKVYAAPAGIASPETYGTQLFADGSGNADAWYFDYQSGILNFPDTNVPSSVTGKKIYVIGARYIGLKGVGTLANLNIGNLSVDSISINNAAILGGYLSNIANITAITANLSSLYTNVLNVISSNIQTGFVGNFSTGNAVINGGYISSLSNITVTTGNVETWYSSNLNSTFSNITNLISPNVSLGGGTISNVDSQINNLSSGNILLSGGVIYNVDMQANNFSTANALITGGVVNNINLQANNFSTANALITGGALSNLTAQINDLSSANVLLTGGIIYNVDLQANNFSTANALITGGIIYNVDLQANNFSAGNALITGGNVAANLVGNISGTFGAFTANINADWFVGKLEANIANFSNVVYANANLNVVGNLIASGNILAQKISSPSGDLHFSANTNDPNAIIRFDSVSALDIAAGNTAQRPPSPDSGLLRYNTDTGSIEWFTGVSWIQAAENISSESISPDGVNVTFTLSQTTSENAILVNINGTIQQAGSGAYSVAGNQITFSEIPLVTDLIEIRYIAGGVAAATIDYQNISSNVSPSANVTYDLGTSVDNWRNLWVGGNLQLNGNFSPAATSGTPSNTSTPINWLKIYVSGIEYYLPLYQ